MPWTDIRVYGANFAWTKYQKSERYYGVKYD